MQKSAIAFFALVLFGSVSLAHAEDLEFYLINDTGSSIIAFHVSDTGTGDWEENLMEGYELPPGGEVGVLIADGLSTCYYDILTEFDDGTVFEDYDLDLCELGEYVFY